MGGLAAGPVTPWCPSFGARGARSEQRAPGHGRWGRCGGLWIYRRRSAPRAKDATACHPLCDGVLLSRFVPQRAGALAALRIGRRRGRRTARGRLRRQPLRARAAAQCGQGAGRVPRMRPASPRLRARRVPSMPERAPGGLQLQRPRHLPSIIERVVKPLKQLGRLDDEIADDPEPQVLLALRPASAVSGPFAEEPLPPLSRSRGTPRAKRVAEGSVQARTATASTRRPPSAEAEPLDAPALAVADAPGRFLRRDRPALALRVERSRERVTPRSGGAARGR